MLNHHTSAFARSNKTGNEKKQSVECRKDRIKINVTQ
jgi:hypothetical protein